VTVSERPEFGLELAEAVRRFASQLCAHFREEIEREPRAFKLRAIRLLKSALPPGPGRPCVAIVSQATEMRARGQSWQQIYAVCLGSCVEPHFRQLAQSRLRSAVRARRGREKCPLRRTFRQSALRSKIDGRNA
jgi:hypothetical protein